jgi:hypothetical protein
VVTSSWKTKTIERGDASIGSAPDIQPPDVPVRQRRRLSQDDWDRFTGANRNFNPQQLQNDSMPMSNFLGQNLELMDQTNRDSLAVQRQIEDNTRRIAVATEMFNFDSMNSTGNFGV